MFSCRGYPKVKSFVPLLSVEDLLIISAQGKTKAKRVKSAFRQDHRGRPQSAKVSMAIVEKEESVPEVFSKDADVNPSSHESAKRLAHKALLLSRDDRAVSSRSARSVPGSVPLYKTIDGENFLVGAIGVSGDHPDQNEAIALAAVEGYEPSEDIKADNYSSDKPVEELVDITILPAAPSPRSPRLTGMVPERGLPDLSGELPPITPTASLSAVETIRALPESPSFQPIITTERALPPSPMATPSGLPKVTSTPKVSRLPPSPKVTSSPRVSRLPPSPKVTSSPRVSRLPELTRSVRASKLPPSPKASVSKLPSMSTLSRV